MLGVRTLLRGGGIEVADVTCTHGRGKGRESELSVGHALVFVRRGCFVRSADGRKSTLDPTLAYCMNPGEEQRYDHPHDGGDSCTSLTLAPSLLAELWGGDPGLPTGPLGVTPRLDLEHRQLLALARAGEDPDETVEQAIELTASMLERTDSRRVASGAPASGRARRALADGTRELLAERSGRSLPGLARALTVSPHHLSRVFREVTGETISRHRMRLRTRDALERLAQGERDLARLAADTGFADQSHLCRVLMRETGETPSALRAALA
ncbi:MAG TPA: helix-turn-helix transcriptional regulator [Solirubrobacteraceae bacterium]|nr:helix-turn-helix transcriptional regulator [Solirubrobacteraceae bacterium]